MYTKVQYLEKELSKAKKKIRSTQNEVSKNRDLKNEKSKVDEDVKDEINRLK